MILSNMFQISDGFKEEEAVKLHEMTMFLSLPYMVIFRDHARPHDYIILKRGQELNFTFYFEQGTSL